MSTDHNLLFGKLALQLGLIDTNEFLDACTAWSANKQRSLAELLVERHLIRESDEPHLEYLVKRKLENEQDPNGPKHVRLSSRRVERRDDALAEDTRVLEVKTGERYLLDRLHATGGMGRVWLARDQVLGRNVALKELRPDRAGDANLSSRFLQEARITGQLEHPGVIPVYELTLPEDREPFYTMRFVNGRTLTQAAHDLHHRRGEASDEAFDLQKLLNAFVRVCQTVAYAHSREIVHRDLKGQNVILGDFGEVVVLDWGFAKRLTDDEDDSERSENLAQCHHDNVNLTRDGKAIGTPAYMAPEQASGRIHQIDARTDVYGLGAMLYEILTGRPPFSGRDATDVLRKVQNEDPVPPRELNAQVPLLLETACLKALSKLRADRRDAATEIASEIERWQEVQRMRAEKALRDSEQLHRSLVDVLPLILTRKDLDGRFTYANKRACESFGAPLEQILGKTDFDFFASEAAEAAQNIDRQVFETGKPIDYPPFLWRDGNSERFFQSIKTPIKDSRGVTCGVQIILWDVDEEQRLKSALATERDLLHALMDNVPDYIYFKDASSRFIRINRALATHIGLRRPEDAVGKTDFDFFDDTYAEKFQSVEKEILRTGEPLVAKVEREIRSNGREAWVSTTKVPFLNRDGEATGILGISREIDGPPAN